LPESAPLICSVVLTWNNFEDTNECLESLAAQDHPNHRVIVVDNGSTDGSLERLRQAWPACVDFVEAGKNLGCGGGYALGFRIALEAGADYVAIIDNDIKASPDLLSSLLEPFSCPGKVALTAPIMTFYDEPDRVWFAGGSYHPVFGYTRHPHMGRRLSDLGGLVGSKRGMDYAPSCAVLASRDAIEEVGLPDERFFFGHDDVDWCLRARAKGYLLLLVARPLALHKVSTTGGRRGSTVFTAFSAYHHAKGSMALGAKHARGLRLAAYLAGQLFLRFPYYSLSMLAAGRVLGPLAYLRGLIAGLPYLFRAET
jgi:GT2 family glycosyltransferase